MVGFHYLLHNPDGDQIGEFSTIVPNWTVGERSPPGTLARSASRR
jgi:hypothetical protein